MFDTRSLAIFQGDFLQAIGAANPPQDPALRVHHDTWLHGLIDALAEVFPATRRVLGDEAFKAFARDYIHATPLRTGDVTNYGAGFGDFLATHNHLGDLVWLPDLARYEQALHYAHHAEDAAGCDFDGLLDPATRIGLHPSVTWLQHDHDIAAVHGAILASEALPDIAMMAGDRLVGRDPDDQILMLSVASVEAQFIALIVAEASLTAAVERLDPSPDDMSLLQVLLARLVQHKWLIAL